MEIEIHQKDTYFTRISQHINTSNRLIMKPVCFLLAILLYRLTIYLHSLFCFSADVIRNKDIAGKT